MHCIYDGSGPPNTTIPLITTLLAFGRSPSTNSKRLKLMHRPGIWRQRLVTVDHYHLSIANCRIHSVFTLSKSNAVWMCIRFNCWFFSVLFFFLRSFIFYPQMVLPNLTTNTFYEVKVRAASISTINPRQVILGSYSEPQKVSTARRKVRNEKWTFSILITELSFRFCRINRLSFSPSLCPDFASVELWKNPTTSTKEPGRLQSHNVGWRTIQLLWNHFNIVGIRFMAVSSHMLPINNI